jgi:hypothetical protein
VSLQILPDVCQPRLIREQQVKDVSDVLVVIGVHILANEQTRDVLVPHLLRSYREQIIVKFAVLDV